ncbi:MAG: TRAP transporter substrate-binding protein [Methylocystaceae bacterium]|nr:TRAP transporter substrate-binding protein [Methylocystaceae bacterium]
MKWTKTLKYGALSLCMLFASQVVQAKELRLSSFEPPMAFITKDIIAAWMDRTNAKLSADAQFKMYAGSVLGAPPLQQSLIKKGIAAAGFVVTTYTPGLFPLSSVVQVPFLAPDSRVGTEILQRLYDEGFLKNEYNDYKVIGLFTTRGYNFYVHNKPVKRPEDLKGMKVRTPSQFYKQMMEMLGASGVSVPAPGVFEALDRGVVDAVTWNYEVSKSFRLADAADYSTKLFYSNIPLAILMNKKVYASLSKADQKVIDDMSGRAFGEVARKTMDDYDRVQEAVLDKKEGHTVITPTGEDREAWVSALSGAEDLWLKSVKELGVDGTATLKRAKEISAELVKK